MAVTGAVFLGENLKKRIEEAKGRVQHAHERVNGAVDQVHAAVGHAETLAKTLEDEAVDLLSSVGQFTNLPPTS